MPDPEKRAPRRSLTVLLVLVLLALAGAVFYFAVLPGLSVARQEPSKLEVAVATYLLQHSVPASAKAMASPLGAHPDPAEIRAGHDTFSAKCETCHAYDGGGRTTIGGNSFPRAPVLRTLVTAMSDGEIFYHIRNGIRNTGMPAWDLPDRQIWQLVAYIRNLPRVATREPQDIAGQQTASVLAAHYVGSKACQSCHQDIYARWQKTAMANVLRDPKVHPDAIAADPATAPEELRFTKDDVAFVYGSKWKQRYWKKSGDTYVPLLAQYNFETKKWSKYHVPDTGDWWAVHYPDPKGDNSARSGT
jgi:mono/diheme cytochrome c family protein